MISTLVSLHKIKDSNEINQLSNLRENTQFILENLDVLLIRTDTAAPVRTKDMLIHRTPGRVLNKLAKSKTKWDEKHWEEACYMRWNIKGENAPKDIVFEHIITYQVPLKSKQADEDWGKIDLLGQDAEKMPVVIELKSHPGEPLLRAITEVVAYGVVVMKVWNANPSNLHREWLNNVRNNDCPASIKKCPLVIAAPTDYWEVCLSKSVRPQKNQTPREAIPYLKNLLTKLEEKGFPITLVEITHKGQNCCDKNGLPVITGAKKIIDM
jgi:hypothetical protein